MKPDRKGDQMVISYLGLRKAIGWLGILLPFILLTGNYLVRCYTGYETDCNPFKSSISDYYYTRMGDLFVGILSLVAIFLICYKGYEKKDNILTNLAGIFAFAIVLFPTSDSSPIPCNLRCYISDRLVGSIHFAMATLFFLTLSYISYFIFTKSKGVKSAQKIERNKIYKICAVVMVGSLMIIALYKIFFSNLFPFLDLIHPVFLFETIALAAFGCSWLIKGEFLFKDKTGYKQFEKIR